MSPTEQFISSLVHALAWPFTVVVLAWLFRSQLQQMFSVPLERLQGPGFDARFGKQMLKVEKIAEELPEAKEQPEPPEPLLSSELEETAEVSPATAVLEATERLERELASRVQEAGGWVFSGAGLVSLARQALDSNLISPETANAVQGIAVLRNLAAHDHMSRLSSAQAREYLSLVDATIFAVKQRPPPESG
jgi:hypothetical protein